MEVASFVISIVSLLTAIVAIVISEIKIIHLHKLIDTISYDDGDDDTEDDIKDNMQSVLDFFRNRVGRSERPFNIPLTCGLPSNLKTIATNDIRIADYLRDPSMLEAIVSRLTAMEQDGWKICDKDGVVNPEALVQAVDNVIKNKLEKNEEKEEDDEDR